MQKGMKVTSPLSESLVLPTQANFVKQGRGEPVVMIHGLAASYHDWDDLIPELVSHGYAAFALDLLGHGESPKPPVRTYRIDWVFDHLSGWIDSLHLDRPPVVIGHSLGGYLALEYALRFPERVRALVLVDPFYCHGQLPPLLRMSYRRPAIHTAVVKWTPSWLLRMIIDASSLSMGHSNAGAHNLSARVRAQTALDYKRTAPGVYHLPNSMVDLSPRLSEIRQPSLVVWGTHDPTLAPASFLDLVSLLPNVSAKSLPAGHVPHQSLPNQFNDMVLDFLKTL